MAASLFFFSSSLQTQFSVANYTRIRSLCFFDSQGGKKSSKKPPVCLCHNPLVKGLWGNSTLLCALPSAQTGTCPCLFLAAQESRTEARQGLQLPFLQPREERRRKTVRAREQNAHPPEWARRTASRAAPPTALSASADACGLLAVFGGPPERFQRRRLFSCSRDYDKQVGTISCNTCSRSWQTRITRLSDPIDVYAALASESALGSPDVRHNSGLLLRVDPASAPRSYSEWIDACEEANKGGKKAKTGGDDDDDSD